MAEMGTLDILVQAIGAKETEEDLKDVQKGLGKTAKSASQDTKTMEKFATRFAGTMAIVTTSMSAAAGALLLKSPIITEIGFALGVLVEELAFMIDTVLEPVLTPLIEGIFKLADKFHELPGPIKLAITVFILLAGALGILAGAFFGLVAILIPVISSVVTIVGAITAGAVSFLGIAVAVGVASMALTVIAVNLGFLILVIGTVVATVIGLRKIWDSNFLGIRDNVLKVVEIIKNTLISLGTWFKDKFGEDLAELKGDFIETWDAMLDNVKTIINTIQTVINIAVGIIKKAWDSNFLGMQTILTTVFKVVSIVVTSTMKVIGTIIETVIGTIIDVIQILLAILRGDWKTVWEESKSVVSRVMDGIKGIVSTLGDSVKGVLNVVISSINKVISGLNSLSITIPDWVPVFGGNSWSMSIPKIPALEVGGKVTETGGATVHKGETVLTKQLTEMLESFFASGGSGGAPIIINIDGHKVAEVVNGYNNDASSGMGW